MGTVVDRFRRDFFTIVWATVTVSLALALMSFSPDDPSFNSAGRRLKVANYLGYIGSYLADLFFQIFGMAAWAMVLVAGYEVFRVYSGQQYTSKKKRVFQVFLAFIVLSSLCALHFAAFKFFAGTISAGGILGIFVTSSLKAILNPIGVAVLLWAAALLLTLVLSQRPLLELLAVPLRWIPRVSLKNLRVPKFSLFTEEENSINLIPTKPAPEQKVLEEHQAPPPPPEKEHKFFFKTKPEPDLKKAKDIPGLSKATRKVEHWELPKLSMLEEVSHVGEGVDSKTIQKYARLLEEKLSQFSVGGKVVAAKPGPAVTLFEYKPNADVKISKITDLVEDLALALSSESLRIIAPLPGRDVVGIETSNPNRQTVYLREILEDPGFWDEKIKLPLVLGKQANGETRTEDLRKMPHLLVAGTTGSGKSVFITTALMGLLFRHSPKTLRLILIDPKQVDLAAFHKVPHLLMPPVKDSKKAVVALKWALREMDKRYRSMSKFDSRTLEDFNEKVSKLKPDVVTDHQKINDELQGAAKLDNYYFTPQPLITIVVEEFGDLMAVDKANVEHSVVRLAQMARACGIHLILAMQSPRKDVVTGLIKTNIPGRISFKVAGRMDSQVILDEKGAERLLARGDMLFLAPGVSKPQRHHGAWISEKEIGMITEFWSSQAEPDFDRNAMTLLEGGPAGASSDDGYSDGEGQEEEFDERYDEILAYVAAQKEMSASLIQRRFKLGYPRAARLIEIFEKEGVVGPANGSKPRQVLVNKL